MWLTAISPIDGRYYRQTEVLKEYFSEYALMKYRVQVEVAYLLMLAEKGFFELPETAKHFMQQVAENFSVEDAEAIKQIEKITNHDVKAVEYFIKNKFDGLPVPHR